MVHVLDACAGQVARDRLENLIGLHVDLDLFGLLTSPSGHRGQRRQQQRRSKGSQSTPCSSAHQGSSP
jgi:hypothetical protein